MEGLTYSRREPVGEERLTAVEVARRRQVGQQITVHPSTTPRDVIAALGALQAQDYRNALWAVGLRLPGSSEADIEGALADGTIVRTWMMRGTLHLLVATDVRWMLELLAPRVIAAGAFRLRQLGIDDDTLGRSRATLVEALSNGRFMTRNEIMTALEEAGVSTGGQRGVHILGRLSLEGLLCAAAMKGRQRTFALLDEWVPEAEPMGREEAAAELAYRYFIGHGPATLRDFVWWSGLTVTEAKGGLESVRARLAQVTVGNTNYWTAIGAPAPPASAGACLLAGFDEYILGYTDRAIALDSIAAERIVPGGNGVFKPAIAVNGRVVGTWRLGTRARAASVAELFSTTDAAASAAIDEALRDYDAFVEGSPRGGS
jgi:hypothetical protein